MDGRIGRRWRGRCAAAPIRPDWRCNREGQDVSLDGAELQHPEPAAEDPEGRHPLSRVAGSAAPADRQHRHQGRGRRGVERAQTRRRQTPGLGLCCTNGRKGDSSRESSVIAGRHEQTDTADVQDQELARLQRGAQATRVADDLVRSKDDVGSRADRQTGPPAELWPKLGDGGLRKAAYRGG
jgi:hypothetical protein